MPETHFPAAPLAVMGPNLVQRLQRKYTENLLGKISLPERYRMKLHPALTSGLLDSERSRGTTSDTTELLNNPPRSAPFGFLSM